LEFFNISNIAFEVLNYELSYVELIATALGLLAVYWASKANIWTWPASVINVTTLFILLYQFQLYADMLLQIYFLLVTFYGWYYWRKPKVEQQITNVSKGEILIYAVVFIVGTLGIGKFMSGLHLQFPTYFTEPAAFPYGDAFTTTGSVIAMILLSRKQIENWLVWIVVDIVSIILYYQKGILFLAAEFGIFMIICIFGYYNWRKEKSVENGEWRNNK
jgi:nicotinamide mononucleotide transporter